MTEQLKSCPFCGSKDIDPEGVSYYYSGDKAGGLGHAPACNDCDAMAGTHETNEENIKAWNTRATDNDLEEMTKINQETGQYDPPFNNPLKNEQTGSEDDT